MNNSINSNQSNLSVSSTPTTDSIDHEILRNICRTTKKSTHSALEPIFEEAISDIFKGFLIGSLGEILIRRLNDNEIKKSATNIDLINQKPSARFSPLMYEKIAASMVKRGAHFGLMCATLNAVPLLLDLVKEKNNLLHYTIAGALCGMISSMHPISEVLSVNNTISSASSSFAGMTNMHKFRFISSTIGMHTIGFSLVCAGYAIFGLGGDSVSHNSQPKTLAQIYNSLQRAFTSDEKK